MKNIFLIFFILFGFCLNAQNLSPQDLIGKVFSGSNAWMCVETNEPRCSGSTFFVEFYFDKQFLTMVAKEYSCGTVRLGRKVTTHWRIENEKIITGKIPIYGGEFLEIPFFELKNGILYGNDNKKSYEFKQVNTK